MYSGTINVIAMPVVYMETNDLERFIVGLPGMLQCLVLHCEWLLSQLTAHLRAFAFTLDFH